MMANFDASKISINKAFKSMPIKPPIKETVKASSTALSKNGFESIFLARLKIFENIRIKAKNPNIPTSPKSLKKSLSVASVIEE